MVGPIIVAFWKILGQFQAARTGDEVHPSSFRDRMDRDPPGPGRSAPGCRAPLRGPR